MINELFLIIKRSKIPVYQLAEMAGVNRNRISQLMTVDELPRNVHLDTLDKIAGALGYTVKVEFLPVENGK